MPLPRMVTCDVCDREVRYENIARHKRKLHGIEPERWARKKAESEPDSVELLDDDGSVGQDSPFHADEQVPGGGEKPAATGAKAKAKAKWFKWGGGGEKKPRPRVGKRISAAEYIGDGWAALGSKMLTTDPPVGRVLMFQAPVAGDVLDDALAGTVIDRVAQPILRKWEQSSEAGALVMVPLTVAMIERRPEMRPVLVPILRSTMMPMLVAMAKGARRAKKRQAEQVEAMEELADFFPPEVMAEMKASGKTPVDLMIEMIFADMEPAGATEGVA